MLSKEEQEAYSMSGELENFYQTNFCQDEVIPSEDIKEYLNGELRYDLIGGGFIWLVKPDGNEIMLGQIRGFGNIQNLFKNEKNEVDYDKAKEFQDKIGLWVVQSLNQELKELLKIKRTIYDYKIKIDILDEGGINVSIPELGELTYRAYGDTFEEAFQSLENTYEFLKKCEELND